jgi:hypothetical protein
VSFADNYISGPDIELRAYNFSCVALPDFVFFANAAKTDEGAESVIFRSGLASGLIKRLFLDLTSVKVVATVMRVVISTRRIPV